MMEFDGHTILVTGASRGIGRAVATRFAAQGARVAVHFHVDREAADATIAALPGGPHAVLQADVSDPQACERLISDAVSEMGRIDVLVNNAGVYELHRLAEVDFASWCSAWERTLGTNLLGPANLMYWAARHMIGSGGGRIINISSRGAFRGEPHGPAYGASKAGLNALSQSLAQELAPHGIFVGVVAPGFVETDMATPHLAGEAGVAVRAQSPLNRAAAPDEIARAVTFLASEGIGYLTGCIIDANGASYLRT